MTTALPGTAPATTPADDRAGATAGAIEVAARGLTWQVDGRLVVDGVDVTPPAGRLTGVLGPNGAGKSTLLRLLAGITTPTAGVVTLDGDPLTDLPRRERARRVALLDQEADPGVPLSVVEVVELGRIPHAGRWRTDPADREIALDALATVGVADLAGRAWAGLSGGERQRVMVARALAQQPRLLLLDEPTNHLDVAAQLAVLGFVRDLGITVLAALHDLTLAAGHCAHVVLLAEGRVVAAGAPEAVLTPDRIREVYGVTAHVLAHPTTGRPVIAFE